MGNCLCGGKKEQYIWPKEDNEVFIHLMFQENEIMKLWKLFNKFDTGNRKDGTLRLYEIEEMLKMEPNR